MPACAGALLSFGTAQREIRTRRGRRAAGPTTSADLAAWAEWQMTADLLGASALPCPCDPSVADTDQRLSLEPARRNLAPMLTRDAEGLTVMSAGDRARGATSGTAAYLARRSPPTSPPTRTSMSSTPMTRQSAERHCAGARRGSIRTPARRLSRRDCGWLPGQRTPVAK